MMIDNKKGHFCIFSILMYINIINYVMILLNINKVYTLFNTILILAWFKLR